MTSPERRSDRPNEFNREYRYHAKKEGKPKHAIAKNVIAVVIAGLTRWPRLL